MGIVLKKSLCVLPILFALTSLARSPASDRAPAPRAALKSYDRGDAASSGTYNVKAYGGVGNATADDTAPLRAAINLCNTNGGVVFLPAGKYNITASLPVITSASCSIRGVGTNASTIQTAGLFGDLLSINNAPNDSNPPFGTGQFFEHFGVNCSVKAHPNGPFQNTGIHLIDTKMTKFSDISVSNCAIGFEEDNSTGDSERNAFMNVNSYCNMDAWRFQRDSYNSDNSFAHQVWVANYVNTCNVSGENIFHLTGGAALANSSIQLNGNIYGPLTTLFELDGGSVMQEVTLDVRPEADGVAGQYQYAFGESGTGPTGWVNSCNSNMSCVHEVVGSLQGYLQWSSGTQWAVLQAGNGSFTNLGILTTSAKTSDIFNSLSLDWHNPCFLVPTNSIAASMLAGTYANPSGRGTVVINHPATAEGRFQVWCK